MPRQTSARRILVAVLVAGTAFLGAAQAQVAEKTQDPTGVSIPYPLVHLVHSTDAGAAGTTADFQAHDPFLLYQLGRDLVARQFQLRHGVYGRAGELSVPLYVDDAPGPQHGETARISRDHASSCGFCHAIPYREPGAGQTIALGGSSGRNTTHFFGAGLIEMLAAQIRQSVLNRYDSNGNGVLDRDEVTVSRPVLVRPTPESEPVDFGDLSPDEDGVPRLNPVFRIWYLDAEGHLLPDANGFLDERVAAYNIVVQPFGWGRGQRLRGTVRSSEGGESSTLRSFYTGAADVHMGMQAHDPTQRVLGLGLASKSLAGAQQYVPPGGALDLGESLTATGLSLDDPDGDGHYNELTDGDLDAAELYMLHAPAPAVRATPQSERGREVLREAGCVRCHVESWRIKARGEEPGMTGDRRFFHFETSSRLRKDATAELVGRLVSLSELNESGERVPRGDAFLVERIYTDFKHWDIGPAFYERRFDGSVQRLHRTAPLWGVGSTSPYGHAGNHTSLDGVIRAHGGAATAEHDAYVALPEEKRQDLLRYLESLVLYTTDEIPADIDGDGTIAEHFEVAGVDVGYERFDARFLFAKSPRYQRLRTVVGPNGYEKTLMLIENVEEAFALDRGARRDTDGDGFPDVLDPLPTEPGVQRHEESKSASSGR